MTIAYINILSAQVGMPKELPLEVALHTACSRLPGRGSSCHHFRHFIME